MAATRARRGLVTRRTPTLFLCGRCLPPARPAHPLPCPCPRAQHCPWLNNAVGLRNRGAFFVFVTCLLIDVLLLLAIAIAAHVAPTPNAWACGGSDGSGTLCDQLDRNFSSAKGPLQIFLIATAALFSLPFSRFWLCRALNILSNLTTNERANLARYSHFAAVDGSFYNPFDRGAARNCHAYFCGPARHAADALLYVTTDDSHSPFRGPTAVCPEVGSTRSGEARDPPARPGGAKTLP